MASRKSLVLVSGEPQQIQAADWLFSLAISNIIRVDVAGSDSTGTRGQWDKPFLTMAAANAVAVSGDVILVGPGTFTITNITLGSGVTLVGSGIDVTKIQSSADFSATGAIVCPGNNSIVRDLTITSTASGGTVSAPFGQFYAYAQPDFTGAILINVKLVSDVYGIYFTPNISSDLKAYNCIISAKYDGVGIDSGTMEYFGCQVTVAGPSSVASSPARGLVMHGGIVRYYGGTIDVSGAASSLNGSNVGIYAIGGTIEIYGSRLNVIAGSFTATDFYNSGATIQTAGCFRSDGAALVTNGTITQAKMSGTIPESSVTNLVTDLSSKPSIGLAAGLAIALG